MCYVNALASIVTLKPLSDHDGADNMGGGGLRTITGGNSRSDCYVIRSGLIVIISS